MNISVQIEGTPQWITAYLSGEIDHYSAGKIREKIDGVLENQLPPPGMLCLDFSGVGFMDSSGVGLILGRYKLMEELGGQLLVTGLSPSFRRMMEMAGLDRLGVLEKERGTQG